MDRTYTNHTGRTLTAIGAVAFGAMLGFGAVAYACSAQAVIKPNKTSAAPGTTVTGTGSAFSKTLVQPGTPVHLRWNSTSATPLWSGSSDANGNISFSFAVPQVANGHYSIVATQGGMVGRAPFQVVGSSVPGASASSPDSGSTQTSEQPRGDTATDSSQSEDAAGSTAGSTDAPQADRAPVESGQTASPADSPESPGTGSVADNPTGSASPAPGRTATVAPATSPALGSRPVVGPAPARSEPVAAAPSAEVAGDPVTAVANAEVDPAPAPSSAAGDLWSGFGSATAPSLLGTETPSPSSTRPFAAGVALLGAGMVAMFAGLSLTVVRRRRALADG